MINYNNLLIEFMKEKNDIIKFYVDKPYLFTAKDFKEASGWDEKVCKKILLSLDTKKDDGCCPWCLNSDIVNCGECRYGMRNRCCCNIVSRFTKIIKKLNKLRISKIVSIKEIQILIEKYKIKTEDMKNDCL